MVHLKFLEQLYSGFHLDHTTLCLLALRPLPLTVSVPPLPHILHLAAIYFLALLIRDGFLEVADWRVFQKL